MYEGGIREPFIARWPKVIRPGSVEATPISSPDIYATLLDVTGQRAFEGQAVDGLSLLPLFRGQSLPERALYWHYPHYGNQGGAPSAAIRRGKYKLIEWMEDERVELFDVVDDLAEQHDLSNQRPELVKRLQGELDDWQRAVQARFPISNPEYDPAKPSGRAAQRPLTKGSGKKAAS
jgi:arylsulfatase A-like enzyme